MAPLYDYFCEDCQKVTEVVKSIKDAEADEICECGEGMTRYFSAPWLNTSNCIIEPQKNWGLGETFTTKNQMKEHIARYQGETGRKLIEVGSENLSSIKKGFKEY
jgi:putative FmdB family regulatory protein